MARHTALARPIIVALPRRRSGRIRRAGRRVRHLASRFRHSRHNPGLTPMAALVGGAALGWVEQRGFLKKLPTVAGSAALTLAGAGYVAYKYGRHKVLKVGGVCAMIVGAFDFGRVHAGGTSGLDDESSRSEFMEGGV